jgi:flagellar biosynthesis/type III secretory pathway protein FliH
MAPKIIKQGSALASNVRKFLFSENAAEGLKPPEQAAWPEPSAIPTAGPQKAFAKSESPAPDVDPAGLEKTAYESGYSQGEKAGIEIAEQKVEAAMKRCGDTILELNRLRSSLYAQVELEVVKLAVAVAKKIVHREIQADPQIIQTLVRVALGHVSEKSAVVIHLNPMDHNYLLEQSFQLSQNEGRDISLFPDKSIERGGCLIHTECGEVDARIEEKFREVENAFFEGSK